MDIDQYTARRSQILLNMRKNGVAETERLIVELGDAPSEAETSQPTLLIEDTSF